MKRSAARRSLAAYKGAQRRGEREEEARREIDPAHGALWKRVGRGIKGTPHERAERFKEYVEENPREAISALDDYADREVARMVAKQTKADRLAAMYAIGAWRNLDQERERGELAPLSRRRSPLTPGVRSDTMSSVARKKSRKRSRKRRHTRRAKPVKVVHMARRRRRRSSSALARRAAPRHHKSRARSAGSAAKNVLVVVGAPAALAILENADVKIPTIGTAGEAGTLGLIGFGLDYFGIFKNKLMRDASIGLLAVAAYDAAKRSGLGKSASVKGELEGYDAGYNAD